MVAKCLLTDAVYTQEKFAIILARGDLQYTMIRALGLGLVYYGHLVAYWFVSLSLFQTSHEDKLR